MTASTHARLLTLAMMAAGCGGGGGTDCTACPAGLDDCAGACVDLAGDPDNCGVCGTVCLDGEVCDAGTCETFCGAGLTDCSGSCRDLQVDPSNCGACGTTCDPGEVCDAGTCTLTCSTGLTDCSGSCRDLQTDRANCGTCGHACASGEICTAGLCEVSCGTGLTNCSGVCSDTMYDPANCGTCGHACSTAEACVSGVCRALADVSCSGGSTRLSTNPAGNMMLCDDPTDTTCEENMATLCPAGWDLCTHLQFANRNTGWTYSIPNPAVGEIYCRPSSSGAGHFTVPDTGTSLPFSISTPVAFNCYFGSSRPSCTSTYGCNEQSAIALCCAPTTSCGNGSVDSAEEACDDADTDETDDCLNTCMWRLPTSHGMTGTNC